MIKYGEDLNSHPQRLAAAGVLLVALAVIGCRPNVDAVNAPDSVQSTQTVERQGTDPPADGAVSQSAQAPVSAANKSKGKETSPTGNPGLPGLDGRLLEGQAYADFRAAVMSQGWAAKVNPACRTNVIGDDQAICVSNPELQLCNACDQMPELSSCSGDGYCGMYFLGPDGKQMLGVTTYGMTEDWNVRGDESRLTVSGWKFEK